MYAYLHQEIYYTLDYAIDLSDTKLSWLIETENAFFQIYFFFFSG